MKRSIWFFGAIFAILAFVFLLEFHLVGQAIYGDARYYWATTRSLYFLHNINISSGMNHEFNAIDNNKPESFATVPAALPAIKNATSSFSLGVFLLWLPFYAVADMLVIVCSTLGFHIVRNGFSDIYQIAVGLGDILVVVAGLKILSTLLAKFYPKKIVVISILLILFATNLFYYASIDALNSHPFSFFLICILLFLFFSCLQKQRLVYFALLGLVVGLLACNRTQDALYILLPFSLIFINLPKKENIQALLSRFFSVCIGASIGYLPQLIISYVGLNHFELLPHTTQTFSFTFANYFGMLFNAKIGIVLYMPVILFAVYGLLSFAQKHCFIGCVFLAEILATFLLVGAVNGWGQESYSVRYVLGTYPIFIFGIAQGLSQLKKRLSWGFIWALVITLILHQMVMIAAFKLFWEEGTIIGTRLSQSGLLKVKILQHLQKMIGFL